MAGIPPSIRALEIPAAVFALTLRRLGAFPGGAAPSERIAYWSGHLGGRGGGRVASVAFADDHEGFYGSIGRAGMTRDAGLRLAERMHGRGEVLFAQVHTHPGGAFHSRTDDANPISHRRGLFSLVVPRFGAGVRSISDCRAYEHMGAGVWAELGRRAASARLRVVGEEGAGARG